MNYYVYVYLDTRKPGNYIYDDLIFNYEPIYVGKGKKRRHKNHLYLRNSMENHFYHKLNKIINEGFKPEIIIIKNNMNENDAFQYEIKTIKKLGKIINNTGPLTNLTDGGEGSSGRICSEETKIKISKSNIGRHENSDNTMKGKSFDEFFGLERSEKIKKLISNNANPFWKNKKLPEEMKNKISETLKNRFENKENHPMYGKKINQNTKNKISESLKIYFKKNPKIVSEETKNKMSISAKKCKKFIIKIKNLETEEILTFNNTNELRKYISKFKLERNIGKTSSPSYNLLINGKNKKYFTLIDKYFLNSKL